MDLKRFVTVGALALFALSTIVLYQNCSQEPTNLSTCKEGEDCGGGPSVGSQNLKFFVYNGSNIYEDKVVSSVSVSQPIYFKVYGGGAHPVACVGVNEPCTPEYIFDANGDCVSEHSQSEYDNGLAWYFNVTDIRCDRGYDHTILGPNVYNSQLGFGVWYNVAPPGSLPAGVTLYYTIQNDKGESVTKIVSLVE